MARCITCGRDHEPREFLHDIPDDKRLAYREDRYRFPVPPVCTDNWAEDDWIRWIDGHGGWITKGGEGDE